MSALFVFLLVAGPTSGPSGPEVKVHRVSLDLPRGQASRLKRYVTIREGEPWDPTKVRQTVEMLFATGEFEDVPVDAVAGPEGEDVVIRPRPSPRLLEVKVEGDAVRSPRELRTLTRLRAGEALWPNRLDAAVRDVTRALVAAGYLEAQVKAEARPAADPFLGADLVFHIAAGRRARRAAPSGTRASESPSASSSRERRSPGPARRSCGPGRRRPRNRCAGGSWTRAAGGRESTCATSTTRLRPRSPWCLP